MKKNMVPLLAIAFVVAIISTGVFYGLFAGRLRSNAPDLVAQRVVVAARNLEPGTLLQTEDVRVSELRLPAAAKGSLSRPEDAVGAILVDPVQEGEPITQARLASKDSDAGVPKGMRAVSIRVTDSAGLVHALRPGAKVDVQAVSGRETSVQLRTILQNVEVLSVNPRTEQKSEGSAVPVATLLVPPQDVDALALADSGAKVRLALRNSRDGEVQPRHPIGLTSLFQPGAKATLAPAADSAVAKPREGSPETPGAVQLSVQAVGATVEALSDIDSKLSRPRSPDSVQVTSFRAGIDAGELLRSLAGRRQLEILSAASVTPGVHQAAAFRAGRASCLLRVQFSSGTDHHGKASLQVKPELTWNLPGGGVEHKIFETEVPGASDFILSGFLASPGDRALLEQLFPGRSWNGRDLVIVVHIEQPKRLQAQAFAKPSRRP